MKLRFLLSRGQACCLAIALTLAISTGAGAQQPAKTDKPEKQPPPPLYPGHRRGMYTNGQGVEVIDATPQSPPLDLDDPGVPEKGDVEINFTGDANLSRNQNVIDLFSVDANYGLAPRLFGYAVPTQLSLEFPLSGAKQPDHPFQIGLGQMALGLKFNFYTNEHRGASFAFYPQLEFAVPGSGASEKGIAETGQTLILPLLAMKEFKYVTAVANIAIHHPIHDSQRDMTGSSGIGVGRALTRNLAAMADIRGESALNFRQDRLVVLEFGLMQRVGGLIFYTNFGHSLLSDNASGHTYFGGGLKCYFHRSH